jgi:hypothetical protein
LETTRERLFASIPDGAIVLDLGGWGDPFERADWVIDFGSYETRGYYERAGWTDPARTVRPARYTEATWIQRDVCDHKPFPFADDEIDFVVCSQTLEDLRDPVWVCMEMCRVAKGGYIEVPSRLEEQSWGVVGPYVGHQHHRWLVDVTASGLEFIHKPHDIHSNPAYHFPKGFYDSLAAHERASAFWWQGSFTARERIAYFEGGEQACYARLVSEQMSIRGAPARQASGPRHRNLRRVLYGKPSWSHIRRR